MYSVRKIMPIYHRRKSTVSLAHAHWPWTNQLNFSRFHEYLHFNSPCNKTTNWNVLVFGNTKTKIMLWKKWMPVQALMRFVSESVKDHINRIRHGLFKRTRKVKPGECKWDWPRVDDTLFIKKNKINKQQQQNLQQLEVISFL